MNCSVNVLEDFLGEEVVDRDGNPVGTLACYWEQQLRRVAQPDPRRAHCATSPAPSTTPGAEVDLPGPRRETPAAPGSHVPGTTSPSEGP